MQRFNLDISIFILIVVDENYLMTKMQNLLFNFISMLKYRIIKSQIDLLITHK